MVTNAINLEASEYDIHANPLYSLERLVTRTVALCLALIPNDMPK